MSYREENGNVILTMSGEDYSSLLIYLGFAFGGAIAKGKDCPLNTDRMLALLNRLNEGNPSYRPYELPETRAKGKHET